MIKNSYWAEFSRPLCYPEHCNCEAYQDGWVIQPAATFTSIPYLIIGLWIIAHAKKIDPRLRLYGLCIATVGVASILAHGTFTKLSLDFDFFSIILTMTWLLFYCSKETFNQKWVIRWLIISILSFSITTFIVPIRIYYCGAYFLLVFMVWFKWYQKHPKQHFWFQLGFSTLLLSAICFYIDESKIWCLNPQSWLQGHSLWHLGSALSLWCCYKGLYRLKTLN